jgi:hypothetical protein
LAWDFVWLSADAESRDVIWVKVSTYSLSIIQYEIHCSMDFGRHFRFDSTKCVCVKKKTKEDALIKVKIKSNATLPLWL